MYSRDCDVDQVWVDADFVEGIKMSVDYPAEMEQSYVHGSN